jgi:hypothetical protein
MAFNTPGLPEGAGQPIDFLIEHWPQVAPDKIRQGILHGHISQGLPPVFPPPSLCSGAQRQSRRDAVQPAPYCLAFPNGGRPSGQHQEGGLENVFCILFVPEHPAANTKHDRPMALDQSGERLRIPRLAETVQ